MKVPVLETSSFEKQINMHVKKKMIWLHAVGARNITNYLINNIFR